VVHVSAAGVVVAPPVEIAGLRSPDHPHLQAPDAGQVSAATARRSRGFESLAAGARFATLYPALESGALKSERRMYAFDPARGVFTGASWTLQLEEEGLTELIGLEEIFGTVCADRFLAVARDSGQGAAAKMKRVYELHIAGSTLERTVVADLLDVHNPENLGNHPLRFTFPYITTEAVWPVDRSTLVLVNDNNFPGGAGRPETERDLTEFIRLRLARPLC
jgi:hypothetical protein